MSTKPWIKIEQISGGSRELRASQPPFLRLPSEAERQPLPLASVTTADSAILTQPVSPGPNCPSPLRTAPPGVAGLGRGHDLEEKEEPLPGQPRGPRSPGTNMDRLVAVHPGPCGCRGEGQPPGPGGSEQDPAHLPPGPLTPGLSAFMTVGARVPACGFGNGHQQCLPFAQPLT